MAASRSFNQRTFEEYDPNVEWSRDAEAEAVKISLPGFKREEIRVLVDNHGHLRTRGERPVAGTANRWGRFQKDFQLPDNCNVDGIRAKFENETLTITLPKKTSSPPSGPVTPQTPQVPEPHRRPSVAAPAQRLPEPAAARPAAPPTVPAATLAPAASQKPPAAERRPSMARKPAPEEPPKSYNGSGGASAATKPQSSPALERPDQEEEERKRMEREAAGKMAEDTKATMQEKAQETQGDEAVAAEMALAQQPRPISATRGLLMNAAVAAVLLLGITVYVWHTLRNATGGAGGHGHGHLGAGSYGDEM